MRPPLCLFLGVLISFGVSSQVKMANAQLIVAHRGASHEAPENTIAAFKLAFQQHADAVEGDFYLSKDGHIVCIHDATTKRTAKANMKVANTNLEELRKLDVGSWKAKKYAGEKIPILSEVFAVIPKGKKLFFEVKCGPEIITPLKKALAKSTLKNEQIVIIAFSAKVIAEAKKQMPNVKAQWLTGYKQNKITRKYSPTMKTILSTLKKAGADGLDTNAHRQVVTEEFVTKLRKQKLEFHCWTINDAATASHFQKLGVDSITTDRPGFLREKLFPKKN